MAMNMAAVLRIVAKVDGGTALQKLGADLAGVGKRAGESVSPLNNLGGALRGVANVAATIGLAAIGRELFMAGDESQRASVRVSALAKAYGEVNGVTDVAARAAKEFALGNVDAKNAVTDLYGRLRPMGVSLKDIETVFFGVNKAAKQVGLTSYDTSEVLLQLSQALGSGKLQGDELRSIMERMPAVGQAVAKVMGVSASEIKKLGSEGKITTEVMIRAAAELNKIQPPPPTALQEFEKAMKDLRTELGENLLPLLLPFVKGLTSLAQGFAALPEPVQTTIIALGALAIAVGPIASVITGIGNALILLGGLNIGGLIAGWLPALIAPFTGLLAWIGSTFLPAVLAFFTGPVGWTVLAVAAVVAMAIAFREPILKFFGWLGGAIGDGLNALWKWGEPIRQFWVDAFSTVGDIVMQSLSTVGDVLKWAFDAWYALTYQLWVQPWINLWDKVLRDPVTNMSEWIKSIWQGITDFFTSNVIEPISKGWDAMVQLLPKAMESAANFVKGVWTGMVESVKGVIRGMLQYVVSAVNTVAGIVNRLIAAFNRLPGPDIPFVPTLSIPEFAKGGYVGAGTLAVVGEAGPEYIIPERKMAQASMNYLNGARGGAVIPAYAQGGYVGGNAQINVTTGPVMQQGGQQYVSMADLERAMRKTADGIYASLRTPAGRYAVGVR